MATRRIAFALVLAAWTPTAVAEGARTSFGVSVQVVAPLRSRAQAAPPPSSFVVATGQAALPCGTAASSACREAVAAAALASGAPVVVTVFTDGTPSAVLER
jgi:hypothetical protein